MGPAVQLAKMPTILQPPSLCIQCLRGARSSRGRAVRSAASVDLITDEANISI